MMLNKLVRASIAVMFLIGLFFQSAAAQEKSLYETAVIYYNEACTMCAMYIKQELIPTLEEAGVKDIIKKDYVNDRRNRVELNKLNKEHNIPPDLQGHFMVFIDNRVILGGHVPRHVVTDLLTKDKGIDKILVLQDDMENAKSYFAWAFRGDAREYSIDTPIRDYIDWFNENRDTLKEPVHRYESSWGIAKMLPLILSTGFLDGINPCAFAVLLFFIAFLYTIHKTKASIVRMGVTYISAIFLAYFLIGIGLVKAFIFTGAPHLMAKISAYLLIVLGILNLANFVLPNMKFKLGIPSFTKEYLQKWMHKATIPAAFVLGFLVGLCTFPCSGGIYVAIVGLLAAKTTYMKGMLYLVAYNIMFVMPLVIILIAASSKGMTDRLSRWERSHSKIVKLVSGIVMIALALAILIWFI
jgi:cytochrome c biogenesis protein CcdA